MGVYGEFYGTSYGGVCKLTSPYPDPSSPDPGREPASYMADSPNPPRLDTSQPPSGEEIFPPHALHAAALMSKVGMARASLLALSYPSLLSSGLVCYNPVQAIPFVSSLLSSYLRASDVHPRARPSLY